MRIVRIERATDARLDMYRDLRDADLMRDRNMFAAEGRLIVRPIQIECNHLPGSVYAGIGPP